MQRTNLIMGMLGMALASVTLAALSGVLNIITGEQEVYAPTGRRGLLCGDMSPMGSNAYPTLSQASICPCDDVDVLNAAYDKYMAGVYA